MWTMMFALLLGRIVYLVLLSSATVIVTILKIIANFETVPAGREQQGTMRPTRLHWLSF